MSLQRSNDEATCLNISQKSPFEQRQFQQCNHSVEPASRQQTTLSPLEQNCRATQPEIDEIKTIDKNLDTLIDQKELDRELKTNVRKIIFSLNEVKSKDILEVEPEGKFTVRRAKNVICRMKVDTLNDTLLGVIGKGRAGDEISKR